MSTYAKADRKSQWFAGKFGSAKINPNCVVWHSTETYGWPGYSGGAMAPNYTVLPDIANKRLLWRAHFEDEQSSRALVNAPGGVETNTSNAVQVEIIGTCNPAWAKAWPGTSKVGGRDYLYLPDAPDWFLAGLADFVQDMNRRHGVPMRSGVTWTAYPGSYGLKAKQRMSFDQWRAFLGHCGHQHVPENDHGDPGALNMARIITLANSGAPLSKPVTGPPATPSKTTNPAPKEGATMALSSSEIDAIALRVLRIDAVPAPGRPKTGNTSWQLDSYVRLTYEAVARIETQNKALVAAVSALSKSQGLDPAKVQETIDAAVKDALSGLSITLTA